MVTRYLIGIIALLLLCSAVGAECISYWECSGWSLCDEQTGFNSRVCLDMNECETPTDTPVQIKRCEDDDQYEVENPVLEESSEQPTGIETESEEETTHLDNRSTTGSDEALGETDEPNLYIGLGIILVFIIIGFIIGKKFSIKNRNDQ